MLLKFFINNNQENRKLLFDVLGNAMFLEFSRTGVLEMRRQTLYPFSFSPIKDIKQNLKKDKEAIFNYKSLLHEISRLLVLYK